MVLGQAWAVEELQTLSRGKRHSHSKNAPKEVNVRKHLQRICGVDLTAVQATVATAHAIARVVYRMLKYKVEYDPLSVNEYQKRDDE